MFNEFWTVYPSDLCSRKGSKKEATKSWDKLMKGLSDQERKEMANKILVGLREWMRHDRKEKKTGAFVPRWPHASTWLNQERYSLEDIPLSTDKPEYESAKCSCGQPTEIVNQCWSCYDAKHPVDYSLQKAALRNIGLTKREGETRQEWNLRCKEYCLTGRGLGRLIGSGKAGNQRAG